MFADVKKYMGIKTVFAGIVTLIFCIYCVMATNAWADAPQIQEVEKLNNDIVQLHETHAITNDAKLKVAKADLSFEDIDTTLNNCTGYVCEYHANVLNSYKDQLTNATTLATFENIKKRCAATEAYVYSITAQKKAAEEAARIEQEKAAAKQKSVTKSSGSSGVSYNYPSGSGVLTKSGGVNRYNGMRETWYSTREAGQTVTARPIPGRYTGSDGIIRDKDGYVCVATHQSDHKFGEVVQTSHGAGKVYDTGCNKGTVDIYTEW